MLSKIQQINISLLYMLIFTIISSALAYHIVVKAYNGVFELGYYNQ